MPFVEWNGRQLFYARQQQHSAGPAVLLIHGAGGSHLDWPAEIRRLPNTAVYAIDLPGHGRSPGPACTTIAAYADIVAGLLPHLDDKRFIVAGHSMGGAVALALALRTTSQLAGIVLIGSGARLPVSPRLLELAQADFTAATAAITHYAWAQEVPAAIRELGLQRLRQTEPAVLLADLQACDAFDARPLLSQIQQPTLVIGAGQDKMAPLKFSQSLAEHIPQAQSVTLATAGHMMILSQPIAVAAAIAVFRDRINAAGDRIQE